MIFFIIARYYWSLQFLFKFFQSKLFIELTLVVSIKIFIIFIFNLSYSSFFIYLSFLKNVKVFLILKN